MPEPIAAAFFRRFSIQVIARILLLILVIFLLTYLVLKTQLYATMLITALLIVLVSYSLIRFVSRTNRELTRFFDAIRYSDFSRSFQGGSVGSGFRDLHRAFREVISEFQKTRSEKEEQSRYLQTVVQHVGIGLIAYRADGHVELINTAAKRILGIRTLKNLRSLQPAQDGLRRKMTSLRSGESDLISMKTNGDVVQLAASATEFRLRDRPVTLVSLQNIQNELDEKEIEAWQKLIRVLTHEIMNSITPIVSLATTVDDMLVERKPNGSPHPERSETRQDIHEAIQTIRKRGEGLIRFVESYRSLSRLPRPEFQIFRISTLFERIVKLMGRQLESGDIRLLMDTTPETLELTADPALVEQALINLLLNAIQVLQDRPDPLIRLQAQLDPTGRILIRVKDNGPGIPESVRDSIFIPFYTTHKNGSGIGLSLCRQIMRLHGGSISVQSGEHDGTTFTLRF